MKISIFGLGYVGCVSTGCLAQMGHTITGVDISEYKVGLINQGLPTIIEKDIDSIIAEQHFRGNISATTDYLQAIKDTDLSFICVGTPSLPTGQLNLDFVFNAARQIAEGLKEKDHFHVVAVRSTVFPGTNQQIVETIEEISGMKNDKDFAVVSNPEFLREGSAVEDYYNPAVTIIGSSNKKAAAIIRGVYSNITAPFIETDIKAAEMIKYVNNSFHALKITFANEIGNICKAVDVDPFAVMELFKMDDRLNISPAYLNPGMPFGGSCLPKDLRGLATIAHDNYIETPVIQSITYSNQLQKDRVVEAVKRYEKKNIGLLGLAFKKGTDDLRYSPSVDLAETLIGKGYDLKIYDRKVNLARLTGANKSFIQQHLPHLSDILENDLKTVVEGSDILVIAHQPDLEDIEILENFQGSIIDLVKLPKKRFSGKNVFGLSW